MTQRKYETKTERQRAWRARKRAAAAQMPDSELERLRERIERAEQTFRSMRAEDRALRQAVLTEIADARRGTRSGIALIGTLANIEAIVRLP